MFGQFHQIATAILDQRHRFCCDIVKVQENVIRFAHHNYGIAQLVECNVILEKLSIALYGKNVAGPDQ
jgi:hypothetical protein